MAYRVRLARRAELDLADIYITIHADSSDTAYLWYQGLRDAIESLRDRPYRCPTTPEDERLRHLLYGKKPHIYRVVYRIAEAQKEIVVLHIRHGARDQFTAQRLQ